MFKKIEIWILYLTIFLAAFFVIIFGALVNYQTLGGGTTLDKYHLGWVPKVALFIAQIPSNTKKALTYNPKHNLIIKEDRFSSVAGFSGNPNLKETYLLLSRYDGNLQESVVELIDLKNFEILHSWNPDMDAFNDLVEQVDEFTYLDRDFNNHRARLIHPKLTKDGGLMFTNVGPLRKINSCSELIFQNTNDFFHHSIETDIDMNIWAPSHLYPQSLPVKMVGRKIVFGGGFHDDAIVKLSQDGTILFEKSVSQIFIENGLEYLLFTARDDTKRFVFDPIHLNDIEPVNFDGEFWKKGDVFLSLRHQSMVLLYRPSTNKILWKGVGPFFHQHDVDILDDHRISIFNNNSKDFIDGDIVDGHNEVVIYNFKSNQYSSYLNNSFSNNDVRTITQGRSQILPNGDLFVEETDYGRTLYFNADGSLRWSHFNRADDTNVYLVGWSRILYNQEDIENVNNFLNSKEACNK